MTGLIRGRDVIAHPILVVSGWGWAVLARCLWASLVGSRTTFLQLASRDGGHS
jgi:hypothetical protein